MPNSFVFTKIDNAKGIYYSPVETKEFDSKFSPSQISDKIIKEYYNLLDESDFDEYIALAKFKTLPNLEYNKAFNNFAGETVYLISEKGEVNPNWNALNGNKESAIEALKNDHEYVNLSSGLPDLKLSMNDINNIKNCK